MTADDREEHGADRPGTIPGGSGTANETDRASRRGRRRLALWLVGGLVLLGALAWAFRPEPVPVDLGDTVRGSMEVTLSEEGETRVRERYRISAPVAGSLLRIELEAGDPVKAGSTVLATFRPVALDPRTIAELDAAVRASRSSREEARADLEAARAELAHADAEAERYRRLEEQGIVSSERSESATLERTTRERAVEAARYRLSTAEHRLEQAEASLLEARSGTGGDDAILRLTSPIDGVVLSRSRESEGVVGAGEVLLEVGDPSRLEVVSDFLSSDAVGIDPDDPVHIEDWGGGTRLEGVVRRVEPSGFTKVSALGVEEQRVNVVIDFEDPREGWEKLGDGYRVQVSVVVWKGEGVLQVPTSALFRHGDGWAVFAVDPEGDSEAHLVPVEVGHRNGLQAEVASGLTERQRVVIHPSEDVADGVKVEPRSE